MDWSMVFLSALLCFHIALANTSNVRRRSHLISDLAEEQSRAFETPRPVIGRVLAAPAGNQLVRKLVAASESKTELGKPLAIWLNVTDQSNTIKSCTWKSPGGVLFPVQPVGQGKILNSRMFLSFV
jgi:hypothetical protein